MANDQQYADIRRRLEAERAELQAQIDAQRLPNDEQATDNGVRHHPADEATDVFLREQNLAMNNNAADLIDQIDDALARIHRGEYGRCDRCGRFRSGRRRRPSWPPSPPGRPEPRPRPPGPGSWPSARRSGR